MKDNYFNMLDELIDKHFANRKKPEFPWDCNLSEYFLLVLDMQNYFLDQSSHAFVPTGLEIINNINKLIDFARTNSIPIAFTRHSNNSDNANMMDVWWTDFLKENTPEYEINSNVRFQNDLIIEKHQYDAFHDTELNNVLKPHNTKRVIICGVMTHLCCETTLRRAFVEGYLPIMPYDSTATYNLDFHKASLTNLYHGFTFPISTDELIKQLETNHE